MRLTKRLRDKIARHMRETAPEEGCGLILQDGTWVPADNELQRDDAALPPNMQHADPSLGFMIPLDLYREHARDIGMVVHSHVVDSGGKNTGPSIADQRAQRATAVPWWVFVVRSGRVVDDYVFGDHSVSDSKYRPGINDQLTPIEDFHGMVRVERETGWDSEPMSIMRMTERLVLTGLFRALDAPPESPAPGTVFVGGDDPDGPPTMLAVVAEDGMYHHRPRQGELQVTEEIPCKELHHILVRG